MYGRRTSPDGLGTVVPAKKLEDVLTKAIESARGGTRAPRIGANIHVSDLIGKCLRKKALIERFRIPMPVSKLSLQDLLTFGQGDAIHDILKAQATRGSPAQVWGKWRCKCGSLRVDSPCTAEEVDMTIVCEACENVCNVYEEVSVVDPELSIVGHPDLLMYLRALDAFYVSELKSISHKQFEDLVRPKPDHIIQVLFYWYLMRKAGYAVVDQLSVFYVTKGHVFRGKPYVEFAFRPTDHIARLEPFLEDARNLLAAREGGELPTRMCVSPAAPDARSCEARSECFGSNDAKTQIVKIGDIGRATTEKRIRRS